MTNDDKYDKLLEELEDLVALQYHLQRRKTQVELALGQLVVEDHTDVPCKS